MCVCEETSTFPKLLENIQTSVHSFRSSAFLLSHQTHVWTDAKGTHKSPVSCPEGRCRVPGLWLHTGGWFPGQLHHSFVNGMTAYNWFATLVSFVCTCCSSFWPKHVFVKRWHYVTVWEILTRVEENLLDSSKMETCKFKQTIKKGVQNWDENFSHSLCGHKSYVFLFFMNQHKCIHTVCVCLCVSVLVWSVLSKAVCVNFCCLLCDDS